VIALATRPRVRLEGAMYQWPSAVARSTTWPVNSDAVGSTLGANEL
jgi:hypothetical protein